MKYKGIELKKITTPQVFDPPKHLLVWDNFTAQYDPIIDTVYAIIRLTDGTTEVIGGCCRRWNCCAEIPEEPKPRRATNRELAKWLAIGIGEYRNQIGLVTNAYTYDESESDKEVCTHFKVRIWNDAEWHEPTVDYMGIE